MTRIRSAPPSRARTAAATSAPARRKAKRRTGAFDRKAAKASSPSPAAPQAQRPAGAEVLDALHAHGRQIIAAPSSRLLAGVPAVEADTHAPLWTVEALHQAGIPVVPWTVNDAAEMRALLELGVDGFITDSPDLGFQAVEASAPALLDAHRLVDPAVFSLQAHRGGRNLRPENTLPAMEVGLDHLANTLESDVNLTRDGVAVLSHEPYVEPRLARGADAPVLIKDLTLRELQSRFVLDRLLPERPGQRDDLSLSPVSVAFARERKLSHPYVMPTVAQLFDFARFYADYYRGGPGRDAPDAERRWRNAERVQFNLETKVLPSLEQAGVSSAVGPLTRTLGREIREAGLEARATVQSFDRRSLSIVQEELPNVRAVYLFDGKSEG